LTNAERIRRYRDRRRAAGEVPFTLWLDRESLAALEALQAHECEHLAHTLERVAREALKAMARARRGGPNVSNGGKEVIFDALGNAHGHDPFTYTARAATATP
jgi:hypothetical protein